MDEQLSRLADIAGIELHYWDVGGRLHETSSETARRLLGALGLPAESQTDISASLARLEEENWRHTLPPVIVATEGQEIIVPLCLPSTAPARLRWSLDLEGNRQAIGACYIEDLAIETVGTLAGMSMTLRRLRLPAQPMGYHSLRVEAGESFACSLIVAPTRCYLPPGDRRYWGVAAQLYAVRSGNNWGMGDFTDLSTLINWAGDLGAAAVGVNPLHALFLDAPGDASPYSPSSRRFLNLLYLDVTAILDFAESDEARSFASAPATAEAVRAACACDAVDYAVIASIKLAILERLYGHFQIGHGAETDGRRLAYRAFVAEGGVGLYRFALFQVLSERFATHDWLKWPQPWHRLESNESLSPDQVERVGFFQYLQWQCAIQLSAAADRAKSMTIGIYNDLAVGVDVAGADHWADQDLFLQDLRVGAPPDPFNEKGQNWGVVAFDPHRLRAGGYAQFIALLRANMRNAGALRIDHVIGWQRLFLIPSGEHASEGAYMRFPLEDFFAIAALESHRNECVVIGEDFGTVSPGFRERMAAADILSCRILYFERERERFHRPHEFPVHAMISADTHDLATLRGYWTAEDIATKVRLNILTSDEERLFNDERSQDKRLLLQALGEEGLFPQCSDLAALDRTPWSQSLADAIHRYLARSSAMLLMVQLDDLTGETRQVNLPGSTTEYPNWRRRLNRSLEEIATAPAIARTLLAIADERGSGRGS